MVLDITTAIIALAVTGVFVGLVSGLLGIGGCFIMVPVQYWAYTAMGVSSDVAIKLAFGTNLVVVLATSVSSSLGHSRRGAVFWRAGIVLGIAGAIGAMIGATIATQLPGDVLKVIFGTALLVSGVRMLTAKPPKIDDGMNGRPILWAALGFPLGIVAGISGIGGGILMIPVMVTVLGFDMHRAVGTSTALMIFTSAGGVLGYIANGLDVAGLPAYSIGYANLGAGLALVATSVPMAQVGVRTAHLLPAKKLKHLFVIALIFVGLKMIGVFGWLGLPI